MKLFWLSFCDNDRPKGQQFLGACIVEVTEDDAHEAALEIALKWPNAQEGAEWIGAASRKAWAKGCNPGGQMMSAELPTDHPRLALYERHRLYSKAELEAIAPVVSMVDGEPGSFA